MIFLKSKDEIQIMRRAGAVVADVLLKLEAHVKPGVTTGDLDRIAEEHIRKSGALPTFVGYQGYPKSLCTSINEEVVHGIPGSRLLKEGDIIGIDCGVTLEGYVADHAITFGVGVISDEYQRLLDLTVKALKAGLDAFVLGNRIGDIGHAVQSVAAECDYGVVRDFVGHGIGRKMHEEPQVPNFGKPGTGPRIKAGMVIAIEPMFNLGTHEVQVLKDGWTVVTKDRKASAHFEHTIAMAESGPVLLTVP
ncbi:MAG: type I methionyl aminopeptidase [Deltaproteobacteria bacterium]|nr:type I methionyl aminopeptidase [Deltaproteobacteria bacterium]